MGMEGCYKCMKYLMVGFNLLVLIIGGAVLGLGIYTLLTDFGVSQMIAILGSDLYKAWVYLLIASGSVTVVISFLGCCGAAMESRCLLGFYFAVMLVLTVFFIAICIIGFVFRSNITGHLQREAETTLINKYGSDQDVTDRWDKVQQQLECCGMTGDVTSNSSWAIYKLESQWFRDQTAPGSVADKQYVPFSCCKPDSDLNVCVGGDGSTATSNQPPKAQPPVDSVGNNTALYTDGCYDKLDSFLDKNSLIIGGIALAALFVMILGVIFSICLFLQIGRQGYVV